MNIDSPALPPLPPPGGSTAPAPAPAPASARPATCSEPSPAPSASACAQLRLTQGDFDAGRVAAIREALASGSYTVRLDRVADGLLAHLNGLPPGRAR